MHSTVKSQGKKRLVVFVPDCLAASNDMARKIYWMSVRENLPVLYLYQVNDPDSDLEMARCITTLKAVTAANRLQVDAQPVTGVSWKTALRAVAQPGDYVVWQERYTNSDHEYPCVPASEILSERIDLPNRPTRAARNPVTPQQAVLQSLLRLGGYLVIIAFFTWVEIYFDLHVQGLVQKGVLILAICLEFAAIWAWFQFDYHHSE